MQYARIVKNDLRLFLAKSPELHVKTGEVLYGTRTYAVVVRSRR
jgi:hypothetical protein